MSKKKTSKRTTSQSPFKDPHRKRELERYERPIPSRESILDYLKKCGGPRKADRIVHDLGLSEEFEIEALNRRLGAMVRDGQLVRNRRSGYGVLTKMDLVRGRVIGHPDGFGFLVPDVPTASGKDVFLSGQQMRSLLHGDRIIVRVTGEDSRGRQEGMLVDILERANELVVGRYVHDSGQGFVIPDNKRLHQDIAVPAKESGDAKDGQIVTVQILQQPDRRHQPIGRVIEVLGDQMAPGMEVDIAIRSHNLPDTWPEAVEAEIDGFTAEVKAHHKKHRLDLRHLPLVTIDGEDARDFDDAVYCEPAGSGWRLFVAIADVSHYVLPDTALDKEAHNRGNSVYFPDRVIPMLPEVLSNGLCSLNPDVDRLCMVCEMEVRQHGAVKGYKFHEAVMRSQARLTYTDMNAIVVEKDQNLREQHARIVSHLDELYKLYQVFAVKRKQRGALEFDSTETRFIYGDDKKIAGVEPVVRNDAHRLIEEFMVAANVAAAEFLLKNKIPSLYRIHEPPGGDKLTDLRSFLSELGLGLGGGEEPKPTDYAKVLACLDGREDKHMIQTVLLRSLRLAVYSPENIGHFGLAYAAYAHFTSPIRRYPDLLVHRAIRHLLRGGKVNRFPYDMEKMTALGEHCSMTDRRAEEATRDAVAVLKCEYMLDHVGSSFEGVISAVTSFGLFVELSDISIEGLVHITELKRDYYHFDSVGHRLVGEHSQQVYRLGSQIKVTVVRVDLDERKIDLIPDDDALAASENSKKPPAKKKNRKKSHKHKKKHDKPKKKHGK